MAIIVLPTQPAFGSGLANALSTGLQIGQRAKISEANQLIQARQLALQEQSLEMREQSLQQRQLMNQIRMESMQASTAEQVAQTSALDNVPQQQQVQLQPQQDMSQISSFNPMQQLLQSQEPQQSSFFEQYGDAQKRDTNSNAFVGRIEKLFGKGSEQSKQARVAKKEDDTRLSVRNQLIQDEVRAAASKADILQAQAIQTSIDSDLAVNGITPQILAAAQSAYIKGTAEERLLLEKQLSSLGVSDQTRSYLKTQMDILKSFPSSNSSNKTQSNEQLYRTAQNINEDNASPASVKIANAFTKGFKVTKDGTKKGGENLEIGQFKFDGGLLFFDEVSRQFRSLSSQLSKNVSKKLQTKSEHQKIKETQRKAKLKQDEITDFKIALSNPKANFDKLAKEWLDSPDNKLNQSDTFDQAKFENKLRGIPVNVLKLFHTAILKNLNQISTDPKKKSLQEQRAAAEMRNITRGLGFN